ncbi:winged helix-turn-helix domain-containing protein [Vibrio sp. 16]|uniref:winged helix-turn-helix domain-containing protein n=1 Tax=Vibrio sp. 16 TaxID=391586 RepID=UPI00018F1DDC|nr:winged helix-turn-helix domain-containing protein [Vibrio sp. 16]EED25404.1 Transcriptional regulatory C terminal domain protein [Vibrio sp. 16]CAK4076564.1 helix-turn-helix domain-containing protein [Vibrio sp. 16]
MSNAHIAGSFSVQIGSMCFLRKGDSGAEICLGNDKSFSITIPESYVLKRLLEAKGEVVDKNTLISEGWGRPDIIGPNSLPVAITNLRKILDLSSVKIVNVPRKGYRLEFPSEGETLPNMSKTRVTVDSEWHENNIDHREVSNATFLTALLCVVGAIYILMYMGFSWVTTECRQVEKARVCYVTGDTLDEQALRGKQGEFYYSSQGGLHEVVQ